MPVFEVVESEAASTSARGATPRNGKYYWRITPVGHAVLHDGPAARRSSDARPLLDPDRRRELLGVELRLPPARALTEYEREAMEPARASTCSRTSTSPLQNKDNDYLMDRAAQKAGKTFSGVEGIGMQDASVQESMGPIQDRTKENLVSTDNGIIMARHRLMKAAKELAAKGTLPPGATSGHQKIRPSRSCSPRARPSRKAPARRSRRKKASRRHPSEAKVAGRNPFGKSTRSRYGRVRARPRSANSRCRTFRRTAPSSRWRSPASAART
jgi:hypothetical protein